MLAVTIAASDNEDARDGYLFLLHEDSDLMLAAKERNCYFVPLSDLKMNSLYSPNLRDTEEEVLKLLNGTTPALVTPINATAIHHRFRDEFADILCQGRLLHFLTVLQPTVPPPCVDVVSSVTNCSSLTDICSTPNAAALCRKYCGLCQSEQLNCDFEHDLCGWTNRLDDQFDWTRRVGPTPTVGTGPQFDHTLGVGGNGHYLYIETSAPRKIGDVALLQSRTLADSDTYCLSFWYYMYGAHLGNLTVNMRETGGFLVRVYAASGRSVDEWQQARVVFFSRSPFSLLIEGIVGDGYGGDIAIDDITIQPDVCH